MARNIAGCEIQIDQLLAYANKVHLPVVGIGLDSIGFANYDEARRHREYEWCATVVIEADCLRGVSQVVRLTRRVTFDGTFECFVRRLGEVVLRHYNGFTLTRKDKGDWPQIRSLSDEELVKLGEDCTAVLREYHRTALQYARSNGFNIPRCKSEDDPEASAIAPVATAATATAEVSREVLFERAYAWLCAPA